jgi:regulator of RNase E activity RraA
MTGDALVSRLNLLDSCAVSDALDTLGLSGAVSGLHRLATDRRIAGRVVTVKTEPDDGRPPASRHLGTTAIEAARPGDVIVVEQRSGIDAAAWGGNLALAASIRGVAGVIVDGPARDLDEARGYDFPIFARTHTSLTARGRIIETGTNVPIAVDAYAVSPGDYVIADASGVVFVAAHDITRVLETAEAIAARERALVASLQEGHPPSAVMGTGYETMLKRT